MLKDYVKENQVYWQKIKAKEHNCYVFIVTFLTLFG